MNSWGMTSTPLLPPWGDGKESQGWFPTPCQADKTHIKLTLVVPIPRPVPTDRASGPAALLEEFCNSGWAALDPSQYHQWWVGAASGSEPHSAADEPSQGKPWSDPWVSLVLVDWGLQMWSSIVALVDTEQGAWATTEPGRGSWGCLLLFRHFPQFILNNTSTLDLEQIWIGGVLKFELKEWLTKNILIAGLGEGATERVI